MIGETLTEQNLRRIYDAMNKIAEIDRSDFFKQYLGELEWRLRIVKRSYPQKTKNKGLSM